MSDPRTKTSKPSNAVLAGNAFVARFKREPVSPSDAAWLNGFVIALESNTPETYERRLAEACERMRRAAALVAMAGDQSMALAIYDHSRRLLGDVPPWWDSENAQKASEQRCPHDGGKCHHGCTDECFRATGGGSLSRPWPGFPVACTHPIKGAMPDIGEATAMEADEGRQCTCAKDNHGVDCAWNGCCGQCSGMSEPEQR